MRLWAQNESPLKFECITATMTRNELRKRACQYTHGQLSVFRCELGEHDKAGFFRRNIWQASSPTAGQRYLHTWISRWDREPGRPAACKLDSCCLCVLCVQSLCVSAPLTNTNRGRTTAAGAIHLGCATGAFSSSAVAIACHHRSCNL